jgi:hypothetical protein
VACKASKSAAARSCGTAAIAKSFLILREEKPRRKEKHVVGLRRRDAKGLENSIRLTGLRICFEMPRIRAESNLAVRGIF